MGSRDEPRMLALLLAFVAALYAVTWLVEGPPSDRRAPVTVPAPTVEVTFSVR